VNDYLSDDRANNTCSVRRCVDIAANLTSCIFCPGRSRSSLDILLDRFNAFLNDLDGTDQRERRYQSIFGYLRAIDFVKASILLGGARDQSSRQTAQAASHRHPWVTCLEKSIYRLYIFEECLDLASDVCAVITSYVDESHWIVFRHVI
jgi:hypothetical protein